jgi:hypothetical protein
VSISSTGYLPPSTDGDQVVFELTGQMLALNHALQLSGDRTAPERTRRAMSRLLGTPLPTRASCSSSDQGRMAAIEDRMTTICS